MTDRAKQWRVGTLTYTTGGLVVLFCWLLWGDFAYLLKDRSVTPTLKLLLRQFNASNVTVGLLMGFIPQLLGLVLVPVTSYYSDRHRGRWGRRIPFLLMPTPFVCLAMMGLSVSPTIGRWIHEVTGGGLLSESAAVIVTIGVCWSVFEVGTNVSTAVFFGLFNDVVPREVLGRFIAVFRMVTFLDTFVFNFFIIGHAEEHYGLILGGIGIFYGLSFTLMCLRVREGEYPPPPPKPPGGAMAAVRGYFSDCFTQPYYLWYFASHALMTTATQPITLFGLYLAKSLQVDIATYGKYASAQMVLSLVLTYPTGWLVDRFHAIRVTLVALALYAFVALAAFWVLTDAQWYAAVIVIGGASAGICVTSSTTLTAVLLPKAKFAQYQSGALLMKIAGQMIVGFAAGIFLDLSGEQYRYIYLCAGVGTALSAVALWVVYRRFKTYGGFDGYVAPEPPEISTSERSP